MINVLHFEYLPDETEDLRSSLVAALKQNSEITYASFRTRHPGSAWQLTDDARLLERKIKETDADVLLIGPGPISPHVRDSMKKLDMLRQYKHNHSKLCIAIVTASPNIGYDAVPRDEFPVFDYSSLTRIVDFSLNRQ